VASPAAPKRLADVTEPNDAYEPIPNRELARYPNSERSQDELVFAGAFSKRSAALKRIADVASPAALKRLADVAGPKERVCANSRLVETDASPSGVTFQANLALTSTAPNSARRQGVLDANLSVVKAYDWVQANHADWYPASTVQDPADERLLRIAALAAHGPRLVDKARRAAQRLDDFVARKGFCFVDGGKFFSVELIQWFIADTSCKAAAKLGSKNRGEAGKGLRKGLRVAVRLIHCPIHADVLKSYAACLTAVVRPTNGAKIKKAHVSVEVALGIQDLANG